MRNNRIFNTSLTAALAATLTGAIVLTTLTPATAADSSVTPLTIQDARSAARAGYPSALELTHHNRAALRDHSAIPRDLIGANNLISPASIGRGDLTPRDPLHIIFLPDRAGQELITEPLKMLTGNFSRANLVLGLSRYTSVTTLDAANAEIVGKPLVGVAAANNVSRDAGVWGADVGITWDAGNGRTLIAFGDNYGPGHFGPMSRFRGSALACADVNNPYNVRTTQFFTGYENKAEEIVNSGHGHNRELSKIPTAAMSLHGVQYIDFMSIRRWGDPGMWTTNFSHIYRSTDYGQTWQPTHIFRPNSGGFANFQMGAFLKHGRYVYEFCTPNGRMGDGYLARVPARSFEELHAWEYWNGKKWIKDDPAAAAPVIPGRISELTVQWNPRLKRFMMLTLGNGDNIYLRYSKDLINWTNRYLLIPTQRAKIYNPYFLPNQSGQTVFFTLSSWLPYQVSTVKAILPTVHHMEKLAYTYVPEDNRGEIAKFLFPNGFPPKPGIVRR